MNLDSWQAGLFLGFLASLVVETVSYAVIKRIGWNKHHREHRHCEYCNGCLDDDGTGIGAVDKLVYCEVCLDTAIAARVARVAPEKRFLPIEHYYDKQKRIREDLQ